MRHVGHLDGDRGRVVLAGNQVQPWGHVGLASTAVADIDDVLPAFYEFTVGQLNHQWLVHRVDGWEVEAVQALC